MFSKFWQHISNTNIYRYIHIYILQNVHSLTLRSLALEQCINSTDVYSPNVGSIYPMQIYILPNVHSWAHRNPLIDTFPSIVGMIYTIPIYINTTDMYSSNLNTNMNITKYIFVLDIFCQQLGKIYVSWRVSVNPLGAGYKNVHFEIKFCIGYKLPTFWE